MREPFRLRTLILSLPLILVACGGGYGRPDSAQSQLSFGVDMAKRSLWSEALFRFHQAERLDPNNPRALNNLAVAYEAVGDYQKALEFYQKALKQSPDNRDLRANYSRFVEFYQGLKPDEEATGAPKANAPPPPDAGTATSVTGGPTAEKPPPSPTLPEPENPEPPSMEPPSPVRPPLD
jgi:tetratricopeptide (TPR) repeat protein